MTKGTVGHVVQVLGGDVDVKFPPEHLPGIYHAVEVERENQESLVLEVQQQLGNEVVRMPPMVCAAAKLRLIPAPRSACRSANPRWGGYSTCWAGLWTRGVRLKLKLTILSTALHRNSRTR